MSFEKLQQTILKEAKQQIDEINNQSDKLIANTENEIKHKAQEIEEAIIDQAEKEGQQNAQRLHQTAQLKGRAQILQAKQDELNRVLTKAHEEILHWDEGKTDQLIESFFSLITDNKGIIVPGAIHEKVIVRQAKKRGIKISPKVIENEGGFIFKSKKTEINLTIKHLLEQEYEHNRAAIAKVLFA